MAWTYDKDAREWTNHYRDGSFGVVRLLSTGQNAQWSGRLITDEPTIDGRWKDSKTARNAIDKAQREHAARARMT